jgi:acyl-coenzyme A thioesterase PaaI-like protein
MTSTDLTSPASAPATRQALYERQGNNFLPLSNARGPWLADTQSGACVAAILTTVLEATPTRVAMTPMNLHIEFLRPVATQPFYIEVRTLRDGQKLQILKASLMINQVEMAVATMTRLRYADSDLPHYTATRPAYPPADKVPRYHGPGPYFSIIDCRPVHSSYSDPGPGTSWMRLLGEIIAGESSSPLACAALFADAGSGLSNIVSRESWSYPNVSLSLHLHRPPRGEWLLLDSQTFSEGGQIAQVVSTLADEAGEFGRAQQALILERKPT